MEHAAAVLVQTIFNSNGRMQTLLRTKRPQTLKLLRNFSNPGIKRCSR